MSFEVIGATSQGKKGPNRKEYEIAALIDGERYETAIEYSIKAAEQLASEKTYKRLQEEGLVEQITT